MKRLTLAILVFFGAAGVFVQLHRFYSRKFFVTTGKAQWIWYPNRIASERPVVFFATRDFHLPPNRQYVQIKVTADPEYVLYFNGLELGGRRFRGTGVVDRYEVTGQARPGTNRIVVAVRSAKGVGGLLAAIDFGPMLENLLVTDEQWNLFAVWSDELLKRDPPSVSLSRPRRLGRPPAGRWNYLTRKLTAQPWGSRTILHPVAVIPFQTSLPMIKVAGGVAVTASRRTAARAYDFGPVKGRARIEVQPVGQLVAKIRYANHVSELPLEGEITSLPVAKGERVVVDPELRRFRYVIVYDIDARATVLAEE